MNTYDGQHNFPFLNPFLKLIGNPDPSKFPGGQASVMMPANLMTGTAGSRDFLYSTDYVVMADTEG